MLLVDSNKRIKLSEIRQLPWFQKDLQPYLFTPVPSSTDNNNEGEAGNNDSEIPATPLWSPAEEKDGLPGRRREWVDGLGVVDQEIVDDLVGKIPGLPSEDVWNSLKEGKDKSLRIAYQLCRDNKRMVEGCEFKVLDSSNF